MKQQQEVRLESLPIIDLPHKWDEHGKLIAETSPEGCSRCHWNGRPEHLVRSGEFWLHGENVPAESFECAKCEIIRRILLNTTLDNGSPLRDVSVCDIFRSQATIQFVDLTPTDLGRSIFISAGAPHSDIDHFGIDRREISRESSLSEVALRWAHERIANCERSMAHEHCQAQRDTSFLPTRLINLQPHRNGLSVRLEDHHAVPPGSPYIALSYCWGDHKPSCMTTPATLDRNLKSIPWESLPRTFQDAASFALSLRIDYLWIDSICIIQGDQEDWQREAGRMFAVYKNSYLTLAALFGSDSTYGLRSTSMERLSVPVAHLRVSQDTYTLYVRRMHDVEGHYQNGRPLIHNSSPLLRRAWTFQERIVSPRVIFFTECEIVYQCLQGAECECGDTQSEYASEVHPLKKTEIHLKTRKASLSTASRVNLPVEDQSREILDSSSTKSNNITSSTARAIADTWRRMVVPSYTTLELSQPRDRLPALGALAEQFSRVRPGEDYLAGLWSGTLLQDLLWGCHEGRQHSAIKGTLHRPFSLPTWSWASLQSDIYYDSLSDMVVLKATVIEAYCSYAANNIFGVLESSKLVLRGRILACTLEWFEADYGWDCKLFLQIEDARISLEERRPFEGRIHKTMDCDQDGYQITPLQQQVHVLEVLTKETNGTLYTDFLILRREGQHGHIYTRGGVATFYHESKTLPQSILVSFEDLFEAHSVMTTCEIR